LAFQAWEDGKCPGCGQPWAETSDRDAEDTYEATPVRCWACAERDRASKAFAAPQDGMAAASMSGLYFTVRRAD
jgi:hypothetical protein